MKAASELIREYKTLSFTIEEKENWLSNVCQEYEQQMPNDRTGQSRLYCLLGEAWLQNHNKDKAETAFLKAKEILEHKSHVRKKVGCGCQEIEKDLTDSPEYRDVLNSLQNL